jgi:uroporphyrinogen decarboxylase
MPLTSRERVLTALARAQPDRVRLDLGGSFVTTLNQQAYACLRRASGLPKGGRLLREQTQNVYVDEDVRQILGIDVVGVYERPPDPAVEQPDHNGILVSEWGIPYRRANQGGGHYSLAGHPLKDATLTDLDTYPWPDPSAPARFAGLGDKARALRDSGYAVVGNLGWPEIFGMAWYLRGFENFLVDLLMDKEMAHAVLRRVTDFNTARYSRFLELVGDSIDALYFGDDLGSQDGLFISPRTYREMIKGYHAELVALIRSRTKAHILFHSCGSIAPLIDDLIEIGIDIINPVQVTARGMDTRVLKQSFGARVSFWGAIDTQHVLPTGSPAQVRAEVRRRITELGGGGGYLVAPTHVIQADVPTENVLVLCQEATSHCYRLT